MMCFILPRIYCRSRFYIAGIIGVDLAGILGAHGERRRWVRAQWGGVWGEVSPIQPTKGSGWASWAPPAGSAGQRKRIVAYFEGHRTLIFVPIWQNLGGTICISVPHSKFWGELPPPFPSDLRPWREYGLSISVAPVTLLSDNLTRIIPSKYQVCEYELSICQAFESYRLTDRQQNRQDQNYIPTPLSGWSINNAITSNHKWIKIDSSRGETAHWSVN